VELDSFSGGFRDQRVELDSFRGGFRDKRVELDRFRGGFRDQGVELGILPMDFMFCSENHLCNAAQLSTERKFHSNSHSDFCICFLIFFKSNHTK